MLVVQNLSIRRHQRACEIDCGSNKHSIRRITVYLAGQAACVYRYRPAQWNQLHAGILQGLVEPFVQGAGQGQSISRVEHGNLPTGDHMNPDARVPCSIQGLDRSG